MNFLRSGFSSKSTKKVEENKTNTAASNKNNNEELNFDDEARALWNRLNLDYNNRGSGYWNPTDPIWKHPTGGGVIYVGNQTAAENISYLT